ncbi:hypothetical protein [Nocardia carnea]|uniref:Uncharacterized protein n=2 Tax=Nocardia carnea TaxID=37328 RepID=A0ABW7TPW4_9NOCA
MQARRPATFVVAEPLPDRCSRHGRDAAVRLSIEAEFAEPDPESQQLTFIHDIVDGPGRGSLVNAFRTPAADAIVTAQWPCCPSCLRHMRFFRWTGRVLVGVAILIPFLSLVPIAAPDWFRSLAIYDNTIAFHQLASFLASTFLSLLIAARGAFSYARPILQARLNENRFALAVSAAHPEFATELDDLRTQGLAAS